MGNPFIGFSAIDGRDTGEATDTEKLWQQVRSLQLQLKGIEEKLYALADQLYTHEHQDGEKR